MEYATCTPKNRAPAWAAERSTGMFEPGGPPPARSHQSSSAMSGMVERSKTVKIVEANCCVDIDPPLLLSVAAFRDDPRASGFRGRYTCDVFHTVKGLYMQQEFDSRHSVCRAPAHVLS